MKSPGIKRSRSYLLFSCYLSSARIPGSRQRSAASHWSNQQRKAGQRVRYTIFGNDSALWLVDFAGRRRQQVIHCNKWDFCWFSLQLLILLIFMCLIVLLREKMGIKHTHNRIIPIEIYITTHVRKYKEKIIRNTIRKTLLLQLNTTIITAK